MTTKEARGWGMRLGGEVPYLAAYFSWDREEIADECEGPSERPVRVVMLPLAVYRRLKRLTTCAACGRALTDAQCVSHLRLCAECRETEGKA